MGSPGGSGAVGITPAARALQRREPLPMRAGQAPEPTPSDDVKKKRGADKLFDRAQTAPSTTSMVKVIVIAALLPLASGHGQMMHPPSWFQVSCARDDNRSSLYPG